MKHVRDTRKKKSTENRLDLNVMVTHKLFDPEKHVVLLTLTLSFFLSAALTPFLFSRFLAHNNCKKHETKVCF